jgi:hypothetical protein
MIVVAVGIHGDWVKEYAESDPLIQTMLEMDVPVLVPSGNDRDTSDQINKWPANQASIQGLTNMIVTGVQTNMDGVQNFSKGMIKVRPHSPAETLLQPLIRLAKRAPK